MALILALSLQNILKVINNIEKVSFKKNKLNNGVYNYFNFNNTILFYKLF